MVASHLVSKHLKTNEVAQFFIRQLTRKSLLDAGNMGFVDSNRRLPLIVSKFVIKCESALIVAQSDLIGRQGKLASACTDSTNLSSSASSGSDFRLQPGHGPMMRTLCCLAFRPQRLLQL